MFGLNGKIGHLVCSYLEPRAERGYVRQVDMGLVRGKMSRFNHVMLMVALEIGQGGQSVRSLGNRLGKGSATTLFHKIMEQFVQEILNRFSHAHLVENGDAGQNVMQLESRLEEEIAQPLVVSKQKHAQSMEAGQIGHYGVNVI